MTSKNADGEYIEVKDNTIIIHAKKFSAYQLIAKDATIDGKTVSNDVAPKIVNDRTMLPIRFVSEKLGADIKWDDATQAVNITK